MQSLIRNLCISLAVLTTLIVIPSEASDRESKANETSTKPSSNQAGSTSPKQPKEGVGERPGIRLSER